MWKSAETVGFLTDRPGRLCQGAAGLVPVRFRFLQCAAGVGVAFNGDVDRPGRGALPGKGLERLQGGPGRHPGIICYHLWAAVWPGLQNNAIIILTIC